MDADGVGTIDAIFSGDPCQPYSLAGNREGSDDDRALWPEVNRLLETIRPRWVVRENVPGNITLGLDGVLADLERIGYAWQTIVFPASAVNAPHQRERVFVVAYAHSAGCEQLEISAESAGEGFDPGGHFEIVADADGKPRLEAYPPAGPIGSRRKSRNNACWCGRGVTARIDWQVIESRVGGMLDGLSSRVDGHRWPAYYGQQQHEWEPPRYVEGEKTDRRGRLKALGNAVNPMQILPIMKAIKAIDDELIRQKGVPA